MCVAVNNHGSFDLESVTLNVSIRTEVRASMKAVHVTHVVAVTHMLLLLTFEPLVSVLLFSPPPDRAPLTTATSTTVMIQVTGGGIRIGRGGGMGSGTARVPSTADAAAQGLARGGIGNSSITRIASAAVVVLLHRPIGAFTSSIPLPNPAVRPFLPVPVITTVIVVTRAATAGRDCLRGD